jgi:hypothetical protein
MPRGFADPKEAKLGECDALLTPAIREELTSWWLVHPAGANTPNWDLASTCTIGGKQGLILVEAKAHDTEPKTLGKVSRFSSKSVENHDQIGTAINEANAALNGICPGWAITRDSHYQLSNRIAWAWKIASLGIPVILVYLGFLNAEEMANCGKPFRSAEEWRRSILDHAEGLVPETVWEQRIQTTGAPMWALIRSLDLSWVVAGIS